MRYEAPKSIDEAVKLLGGEKGHARILAGGTDLLVQMKSGRLEPDLVVDIKRIDGMRKISIEKGSFRIGAAVSGAEINEHAELMKAWPGVAEAANLIGSTQVRGRASLVGNLCNASPAADSVPALVAADAKAVVAGSKGRREVPIIDIPTAPGKTSLAKDEIVEAILLPAKLANTGDAYLRFIPRTEMDIAVVGVGVCLTIDGDDTCRNARVALGAVGPRVILSEACARALIGTKVDEAALNKLAAAASAAATPIDDKRGTKEFRTDVTGVLAKRAAKIALERAKGK